MKIKKGTIILDLTQGLESLWKQADKKNRWSAKKARKSRVTIREGTGQDEARCYQIYKDMCAEHLLKANHRKEVFDAGRIFVAEYDGEIVACSIVEETPPNARLRYNASTPTARETQANALLYWEVIKHYHHQGFHRFDLGGVDLHARYRRGNDRFKERWGGTLMEKTQEVAFLEYLWWRWLRHSSLLRKLKWWIQ